MASPGQMDSDETVPLHLAAADGQRHKPSQSVALLLPGEADSGFDGGVRRRTVSEHLGKHVSDVDYVFCCFFSHEAYLFATSVGMTRVVAIPSYLKILCSIRHG